MKAVLIRTGSAPVQLPSKVVLGDHDSISGILFPGKNSVRSSLHLEIDEKKKRSSHNIRRTMSDTNVIFSVNKVTSRFSQSGSRSFPTKILEEEEDLSEEEEGRGGCDWIVKKIGLNLDNIGGMTGIWLESHLWKEEIGFSDGGIGNGRNIGGGNGGGGGDDGSSGGNDDQTNMSDYYTKLLEANPGNPLILRNYGKYLHEVKGDMVRAEECYSRAILASPRDGEILSLYGKLIWDSYRDREAAESYFDQAIQASPDDCYIMGSYANFLWSAEEDGEDVVETSGLKLSAASFMVEAC